MTARGTIALVGVFALLALYVWLGEIRGLSGPPTRDSRVALGPAQEMPPEPRKPAAKGPGLVPEAPRAERLTLTKEGRAIALERTPEGWRASGQAPLSGPAAADLDDFLRNLSEIGAIMTVDKDPQNLGDYGLKPPGRVLTIELAGGRGQRLEIGQRNPVWTASYARLGNRRQVILIGALLVSQFDRIYKRLAERTSRDRLGGALTADKRPG